MTDRTMPGVTDRDVYITRSFAAPIDVVWKFWTDPDLLARWFGPHGISVDRETVSVDARPGGTWNLEMHDDAGVYPIASSIVAIDEPHYLELLIEAETGLGHVDNVILRIQFHDHGDITRMTLHQGPFTPELRDLTRDGWTESFLKLDTILEGA